MTGPIDTEAVALSPTDKAALTLAIEVTRRESPGRSRQIDSFLSSRGWLYTARFCASCAQSMALRLPPWQSPPCDIGKIPAALNNMPDEARCGYRAAALSRLRMEKCGVSRWHPDPVAACEAAEAKAKQQP